ncbi:MAG: GGDEF domain-containing protein [Rhodospirillales bacterium]|nr:GGDEF domain-containing protein [Rhodospirillales bacterium]
MALTLSFGGAARAGFGEEIHQHWGWALSLAIALTLAIAAMFVAHQGTRKRRELEDRIRHMASHDTLTNFPNCALLMDRLKQVLAKANREGAKIAVLFLDLDDLTPVNNTMGQLAGDLVIKEMAERMLSCLRKTDTVARFGGDEFAIILTDIKNPDDVDDMAENLNKVLAMPVDLDGKEACLGASIGISLYPEHGRTADLLLSLADEAMHVAKKEGKKNHRYSRPPK